jgi:GTP-binding protein
MIKNVKYLLTTHRLEDLPVDDIPEIVIVGRSNVGKSSLINALTGQKIAYVGKTPGKTRAISLFDIDGKYRLVDVPGYGYAKVSDSQKEMFADMIDTYLTKRENLKHAIVLLDTRRGITEIDEEIINFFVYAEIPFSVVGTKMDKLNQSMKHKFQVNVQEQLGTSPLLTSSLKKRNMDKLIEHIESVLL